MSQIRAGDELFGNRTTTENGAGAYKSTLNTCLDLFYAGGASRDSLGRLADTFDRAMAENPRVATAIKLWIRDIRNGGAGERKRLRSIAGHPAVSFEKLTDN